ncbi:MAG: pyridoxamine 5'-phosphate oxidase [Candidatus Rokuibacteriota bacterium]|nr:MAG: pyridoxamine 5'-phosphate oxidase [Candidatus Rokubacteria bacterium]
MSRHLGPPPSGAAPVPEPAFAERARTLVELGRTGALSTLSRRHPGHPFGSVMPYALDARGRPLFLISSLAMHTQNLQVDRRASLLVSQAVEPGGDPLAAGRVTLVGEAAPLPAAERAAARAAYLAWHPNAQYWVDFEDFAFYRLELLDVYFVGGFAAMDWVGAEQYLAARPDPLAEAAAGILAHMNRDHADALLTFARVLGQVEADEASMVGVDRLGFKLRVRSGDRLQSVRIAFPREVTSADASRAVLIEMLRDCRQRTAT